MEHLGTSLGGEIDQNVFPFRIGFYTSQTLQFYDTPARGRVGAFQLAFAAGGFTPAAVARESAQWGRALKQEVRNAVGRTVYIVAIAEQLPDAENRVLLDATVRDCFGDPAPQMRLSVGNYERRTMREARAVILKILNAAGARVSIRDRLRDLANRFHGVSHHSGGCRMGLTPENSVVDPNLKVHGVANPTLTIAALALRAGEHLAAQQ